MNSEWIFGIFFVVVILLAVGGSAAAISADKKLDQQRKQDFIVYCAESFDLNKSQCALLFEAVRK